MKTTFRMAPAIITLLSATHDLDKIVQACESSLARRTQVKDESLGMRNLRKDEVAQSRNLLTFEQGIDSVSAFIQYAEAEVGTWDKAASKLEKLGGVTPTLSYVPQTLSKESVGVWLDKFRLPKPETKPEPKPEPKGKGKGKVESPVETPVS